MSGRPHALGMEAIEFSEWFLAGWFALLGLSFHEGSQALRDINRAALATLQASVEAAISNRPTSHGSRRNPALAGVRFDFGDELLDGHAYL